jgi:cytochrome c-type protein NapC
MLRPVHVSWLGIAALGLGAIAAAVVIGFLTRAPKLTASLKLVLFLALFVLPTGSAFMGNASNMEASKNVEFCNGCHVMNSYVDDVRDPNSTSLASLHGRLEIFRDEACYECHADYGMFGGVTTKIGGMHHVEAFYTDDWSAPGHRAPALYKPYDMRRCLSCHDPLRKGAPLEHQVHAEKIKTMTISCSAEGCHGHPHPPWKQSR